MAEPKYGGAYISTMEEATDPKPKVDEKCHAGCMDAWAKYEACSERVEEKVRTPPLSHSLTVATVTVSTLTPAHKKSACPPRPHTLASRLQGRGECSGYYMDYFKCIDKCAVKSLFKQLA